MASVRGQITVTQELRFQLVDDQGRTLLFALSHGAPIEPGDLENLCRSGAEVQVEYEEDRATLNGRSATAVYLPESRDMSSNNTHGKQT